MAAGDGAETARHVGVIGAGIVGVCAALWLQRAGHRVFLVVRVRRRRLPTSVWFYRAVVLAGPASVVALIAGWVTTEVGRQPWVVYHVMRTSQAVTGAGGLPIGYATLALAYVGVAAGVVWILRRLSAAPMETPASASPQPAGG